MLTVVNLADDRFLI